MIDVCLIVGKGEKNSDEKRDIGIEAGRGFYHFFFNVSLDVPLLVTQALL